MLGRIIKDYINEKGMIQKRIAERAGIQRSRFNDILNGKRPMEASEYFRICDALEVGVDTFAQKLKQAQAQAS